MPSPQVAILGGSFNPVHHGHIRLAVEVLERFRPERLDVIPCGSPPHKPGSSLLPFPLRLTLVQLAFEGMDQVHIRAMEGDRPGPSYTVDTLAWYQAEGTRPLFVMGVTDFLTLPEWHEGERIPELADLALIPRLGQSWNATKTFINDHWSPSGKWHGRLATEPVTRTDRRGLEYWSLGRPSTGEAVSRIYYAPMPRLDLSASLIREKWRQGGSLRGLTPRAVEEVISAQGQDVQEAWGK